MTNYVRQAANAGLMLQESDQTVAHNKHEIRVRKILSSCSEIRKVIKRKRSGPLILRWAFGERVAERWEPTAIVRV